MIQYNEKCSPHGLNFYVTYMPHLNDLISDGQIIWEMGSWKVLWLHNRLAVKTAVGHFSGVNEPEMLI